MRVIPITKKPLVTSRLLTQAKVVIFKDIGVLLLFNTNHQVMYIELKWVKPVNTPGTDIAG